MSAGSVGALGSGIGAFVDDLVEDLSPALGNRSCVRVGEQPRGLVGPVFGVCMPSSHRVTPGFCAEAGGLKAGPEIGGGGAGRHRDRLSARPIAR